MKHEELLKEIRVQIERNILDRLGYSIDSRRYRLSCDNNSLLCKIETVLKNADKEYERGAEDAWTLARKIVAIDTIVGYSDDELKDIFGYPNGDHCMRCCDTYQEALVKLEAYEKKKEEEAKKSIRGELVHCRHKYSCKEYTGIVHGEETDYLYIIAKDHMNTICLLKSEWIIQKTGKHVDLDKLFE